MSATKPIVELDSTQYVNLNTLSGIAVGTDLSIQNLTTKPVKICIAATQPPTNTESFVLIPDKLENPAIITGELLSVWVLGQGSLSVQEL